MTEDRSTPPRHPVPAPAAGRLGALVELVEALRGPQGCPWDREQTAQNVRPYLLEEAHEVAAALDEQDWPALRGELGDLLFQIVFLASLAHEAGAFDLGQVIDTVHGKMVERHPHVFGDGAERLDSAGEVREAWEKRKVAQREFKGEGGSILAGVSRSLPALVASYRLTQKAAGVGFDWPETGAVFAKLAEETAELHQAIEDSDKAAVEAELGDLLFTTANLARKLDVDPEAALAGANRKFRRRFESVEIELRQRGARLGDAPLALLDELWNEAKAKEPQFVGAADEQPSSDRK